MWIFGYGSLIFRPGFEFAERRRAWVASWTRRFWQASPDHRGTPERPGRVVTLVREDGGWCGGTAYRVDPAGAEAILAALDAREQAGFERVRLALYERPGESASFAEAITYIAGPSNPHYGGELDDERLAAWIREARGPSGANADYARELHAALRGLGIHDPHVEAIVARLRGRARS